MEKIVIFDRCNSLLSLVLCKLFQVFGWKVISYEDNGLKSVKLFSFADLSSLKTANLYNRKGIFVDEFLDKHIAEDNSHSLDAMHRTVIFQFINSRLANFDYLAALIEEYLNQNVELKVFIHETGFAKEFLSHFNIAENIIFLPNFRLVLLPYLPNDIFIRSLQIFKNYSNKLWSDKIKNLFSVIKTSRKTRKLSFHTRALPMDLLLPKITIMIS